MLIGTRTTTIVIVPGAADLAHQRPGRGRLGGAGSGAALPAQFCVQFSLQHDI